ncbi:MAG: hypothetical protein E7128_01065 [Rikenellaceae bacterium]|nr:hypothetical protein [Rikenellaceae bacterium]
MKRVTLFAILLLGVAGCTKGFEPDNTARNPESTITSTSNTWYETKDETSSVIGHFENYYKLEHMRTAYSNLKGATRAESISAVQPTHRYYKFSPKDIFELADLEVCKDIEFFPYPLDAIISEGENFETDTPSVRYAVVPIDYDKLPNNVERELLYEMFVPDDIKTRMSSRCAHIDSELAEQLVDEAMRITGNEEEPVCKTRASTWYGSGRVVVWDTYLNYDIPLRGVKVRITRAGVTYTAITDSLGYFRMTEGFKYGATYSIVWEREHWNIRAGATGQATVTGPKVTGESWNCRVAQGSALRIGHMHRACYRHFYQTKLGYPKAIPNNYSLKLSYMPDLNDEASYGFFYPAGAGVVSDIRVFKGSSYGEQTMPGIFGTTSHELGHAGHCFTIGWTQFDNIDDIIKESWANAVAYYTIQEESEYLTRNSHTFFGTDIDVSNNIHYKEAQERYCNVEWPFNNGRSLAYSPLFIDLIDDDNQSISNNTMSGLPNDVVSGYSFATLGNILQSAYSTHSLKSGLRSNLPTGVTSADIDTLFAVYEANWVVDID